ncbi:MAG: hypothetical protein HC809_03645 [Gammaproteobacteria bacterium]|nr:hypothetical protein [Gammaproteobacteria bacterium]
MAKNKSQQDESNDEAASESAAAPAKAGGMGRFLIMGGVALAVMGASIGGTLYFVGAGDAAQETTEQAPAPVKQVAIYHNLRPAFIVNFLAGNKPRYLQAELTVMARGSQGDRGRHHAYPTDSQPDHQSVRCPGLCRPADRRG